MDSASASLLRTRKPSYDLSTPNLPSLHTPPRWSPAHTQGTPGWLSVTLWTQSWLLLCLGAARVPRTPQYRTGENDISRMMGFKWCDYLLSSLSTHLFLSDLISSQAQLGHLCPAASGACEPEHDQPRTTSTYSALLQQAP